MQDKGSTSASTDCGAVVPPSICGTPVWENDTCSVHSWVMYCESLSVARGGHGWKLRTLLARKLGTDVKCGRIASHFGPI